MNTHDVLDKLKVMLPHWIEHNSGHVDELRRWRQQVGNQANPAILRALDQAIAALETATNALTSASGQLGAQAPDQGHRHGEHGHHHHRH